LVQKTAAIFPIAVVSHPAQGPIPPHAWFEFSTKVWYNGDEVLTVHLLLASEDCYKSISILHLVIKDSMKSHRSE
jgi:hypothetical protein